MRTHRRLSQLVFLMLSASTLLTIPAARADLMSVSPGFGGIIRQGAWTPIAVRLANTTGSDIEGSVNVSQEGSARYPIPVCIANVKLPANSIKVYHVYAKLRSYGGITVSLRSGIRTLAARKFTPSEIENQDEFLVSIGDRGWKPYFLNGEKMPTPTTKAPAASMPAAIPGMSTAPTATSPLAPPVISTIHASSISPQDLPDRPSAYGGVDVLVMRELPGTSVDPRAFDAIAMWVASGGVLVVSTGPNYRAFDTPFFKELLPVRITGATSAPSMASFAATYARDPFPAGPVSIAAATPGPGCERVLRSDTGALLYAERTYGAGKVIFLAFDCGSEPFTRWNGQTGFWTRVLASPHRTRLLPPVGEVVPDPLGQAPGAEQEGVLADVVQQSPRLRAPGVSTIAVLLLAYVVVLVPVNFMVLKKRRKLEAAWLTTPAIVVVFLLAEYAIGYAMRGGHFTMDHVEVVEGSSGARYAASTITASVFSPTRRSYTLTVNDPFVIPQAMTSWNRRASKPIVCVGEQSTIDLYMPMWTMEVVEGGSGVDLGGAIRADIMFDGANVEGVIENNTDQDLHGCEVIIAGSVARLGNVNKGARTSVKAPLRWYTPADASGPNAPGDLRLRLRAAVESEAMAANEAVLVAQLDKDNRGLQSMSGGARTQSARYGVFHINLKPAPKFVVQAATMQHAYEGKGGGVTDAQSGIVLNEWTPGPARPRFTAAGECDITFKGPMAGDVRVTSMTLTVTPDNSLAVTTVWMQNASTGAWTRVQPNRPVPNPDAYVRKDGRVKTRVELRGGFHGFVNVLVALTASGERR